MESRDVIRIQGAREHNLKGVDVDVPRRAFVVVCGVSGSGKSSLALATLAREGRRRFLQTIGDWNEPRPDVDLVEGVPPTVALEQRRRGPDRNERLSTCLEVHDGLALLWASHGVVHCTACGRPLPVTDRESVVRDLEALASGTRIVVMAPVLRGGDVGPAAQEIQRQGFVRVRFNQAPLRLDEALPQGTGDLDVVVDRITLDEGKGSRIEEAIAVAFAAGRGRALVQVGDEEHAYTDHPYCPLDDLSFPVPTPALLSYRSALGMCATCAGKGEVDGQPCTPCGGSGLGLLARQLRFTLGDGSLAFSEALALPLGALRAHLSATPSSHRLEPVRADVVRRLELAMRLHLEGLPLGRRLGEVSATEWTRARLGALVGSELSGVLYVLDEPTDGLDAVRTDAVLDVLNEVVARGNGVVVVGHDPAVIGAAGHVIELGPGAGEAGGSILFEGDPTALAGRETPTGRSLALATTIAHRPRKARGTLALALVPQKNLSMTEVDLALGVHTVVTGPPGSGKTALVEAMTTAFRARTPSRNRDVPERLLELPHAPLGQSATSCVATAGRVWNAMRILLAETRESKLRGFGPDQFSMSRPGGRCEACKGVGRIPVVYEGTPRFDAPCEVCEGRRFDRATLRATFLGVNAAEILALTVAEARALFQNQRRIATPLVSLERVGLGYLRLGQPSGTLSGGEAQRLRLARELATGSDPSSAVAFLDTPSSGLHPQDLRTLLDVLDGLVDAGLTLVSADLSPLVLGRADGLVALEGGAVATPRKVTRSHRPSGAGS